MPASKDRTNQDTQDMMRKTQPTPYQVNALRNTFLTGICFIGADDACFEDLGYAHDIIP